MKRDFQAWLSTFKESIATYSYYVDFNKVYSNVDSIKIELNILNSLIGSKNIRLDFEKILTDYPETLRCIPILLAVRKLEIAVIDEIGEQVFDFKIQSYSVSQYSSFMDKSGLFDLIQNRIINNLVDYVTGVEVGLDSNGRKNRGGHIMENLVEGYFQKAGLVKNKDYFKEIYIHQIKEKWNIDLSAISNQGKREKRFDFVVKTKEKIFAIETNFYGGGGSKLNETARSYKGLAKESSTISGFEFVWFTDGKGWISARNSLEETFENMEHIYCIHDLECDIVKNIFK